MINEDPLRIASPQTIAGNFTQAATGALDLDFAGDTWEQYGALTISGLATLDGRLSIDLTGGFTLATHDTFDILGFAGLAGPGFGALWLDGSACKRGSANSWRCGGGVRLTEAITSTSLDLVVAQGSLISQGSAVPELSTWALLALGFLGLGGLGLSRRGSAGRTGSPPSGRRWPRERGRMRVAPRGAQLRKWKARDAGRKGC